MNVLALVNAHSLAHVTRPLGVAGELRARGHRVQFAGAGRYLELARDEAFECFDLPYVTTEQMNRAVKSGKLGGLYDEAQLTSFVDAELSLYARVRPDVVIADCRITATTSAALFGVSCVGITNAHMTNYRRIPFFSVRNRLTDAVRPSKLVDLADRIENAVELRVWDHLVTRKLNRVRRARGLPKLFAYESDEGDLCLLADAPEFNPSRELPQHVRYVGPLPWKNERGRPDAFAFGRERKKMIFVSLGSEGLGALLGELVALASAADASVVIALGENTVELPSTSSTDVVFAKYVDLDQLLPQCDLVVCHGGNGTVYQALSHGVPVLAVSCHEEQHYNVNRLRHLGLGLGLRQRELRARGPGALANACRQLLDSKAHRVAAARFERTLAGYDARRCAADAIETLMRGDDRSEDVRGTGLRLGSVAFDATDAGRSAGVAGAAHH